MVFDAGPEPVALGGTVTLSGRSWRGPAGNRGRINVTFQRYGTIGFVLAAHATADDAGRFRMRVPARATGTWKATRAGTGSARLDTVQVLQRQPRQLVAYGGELTAWQAPRVRIPSADYRAVVTYRCAADGYFSLHWNGDSNGFEYVSSTRPDGTITLNGHSGARGGYFEVSTWPDCVWSVRVFSGSVLVQV